MYRNISFLYIYVITNTGTYIADTYDIAEFTAGYYLLVNTVILYK